MKQWVTKYKHLPRFQKILFWLLVCFLTYVTMGFFLVPPIAKHIAAKKLTEILDRNVSIEKVKLNPLILKLSVLGFSIQEKDEDTDFVSFSRFDVNLQISSVFRLAPVIKEVKLDTPYFKGIRHTDGSFNFTDIIEKNRPKEMPEKDVSRPEPFQFAVYNIEVLNGNAEIIDESVGKTHRISGLSLGIPFISNLDKQIDVFVQPYFNANFNETPIVLTGQTKPFHDTLETSINIDLKEIDMPYYFAYLPVKTNLDITSGNLDLQVGFYFYQKANEKPSVIAEGALRLKNLTIADRQGNPILNLPEFYTKLGRSHLVEGDIHVEKITVTHPEIGITRRQDRTVNLYSLVPVQSQQENGTIKSSAEQTQPMAISFKLDEFSISQARLYLMDFYKSPDNQKPDASDILQLTDVTLKNLIVTSDEQSVTLEDARIHGGDLTVRRQPSDEFNFQCLALESEVKNPETTNTVKASAAVEKSDSWTITLKTFGVDQFNVFGKDLAGKTEGDMTLNDIHIAGENISTKQEHKGNVNLSFKVNEKATVDIKSHVQATPALVTADMDVKDIMISWAQPFIKDKLNLIIKDGKLAATSRISASMPEGSDPDISYKGDATISNLMVYDKSGKEKIIQFEKLSCEKIDAGYPKMYANLAAVRFKNLETNIIRKPDGNLNITDIVPAGEKAHKTVQDTGQDEKDSDRGTTEDMLINVAEFSMENGRVNFIDRSLSPYFETALEQIQVKIKGLSSKRDQRADLDFSAKIDGHAPLKITGQLNPLSKDVFADLDLKFNNMELSPASPYSGKYVGNKIRKGKLSFDLAYLIQGTKLDASNQIFIDQIELGEKVKSPDATNLPVGLGIALLKDPSGRINLDIPVQGDLADPEFSLGGTIMKVIVNLLVKAATSPFALLGSMFGGGEDINLVYFDPGVDLLQDTENEKLNTIITAFSQRPALNLEIKGYSDMKSDRSELLSAQFNQLVAAEKIQKKDNEEVDTAQIELTPEEYEKYLKKVYKKAKKELKKSGEFEEPDDVTQQFMEETIKNQIQITDDDLKLLAAQRALAVKDYLMASEKIGAERIFIVEPDSLEPASGEGEVKSRVELGIK